MLSLIGDSVLSYGWMTEEELLNFAGVETVIPGPIAVNMATFVGSSQAGFLGSLVATVAICIPSFIIIFTISLFFDAFLSLKLVEYAFRGIQVCVIYLIFTAGINMLKKMRKTVFSVTIVLSVVLCMILLSLFAIKLSTIIYILICGCIGLIAYCFKQMKLKKEDRK